MQLLDDAVLVCRSLLHNCSPLLKLDEQCDSLNAMTSISSVVGWHTSSAEAHPLISQGIVLSSILLTGSSGPVTSFDLIVIQTNIAIILNKNIGLDSIVVASTSPQCLAIRVI